MGTVTNRDAFTVGISIYYFDYLLNNKVTKKINSRYHRTSVFSIDHPVRLGRVGTAHQ